MADYLNNMTFFGPILINTKKRLRPVEVLYAKLHKTNMFSNVCENFT